MPLSKKRKKNGKTVKRRGGGQYVDNTPKPDPEELTGVSLQDLIDVVAYQQYVDQGKIEGPQIPDRPNIEKENP